MPWGASSGRCSCGLCRASACGRHDPRENLCIVRGSALELVWAGAGACPGQNLLAQARSTLPEDALFLSWLTGCNPDTEPHRQDGGCVGLESSVVCSLDSFSRLYLFICCYYFRANMTSSR